MLLAPLRNLLASASDRPTDEQLDLHAAVRAAERLTTMVDALLDFTGAEARTLRPARQPTDLAELTADTTSMFRAAAEHSGLTLDVELPTIPLTAQVDRAMWSTIVTNLLFNAVKYTSCGGIRVTLTATEADAVLTVADTGRGIEPDQQTLIFRRFHRASDDGQAGAGIGLAVVADLVQAHQGRIDLDSTPGHGSTFTVTLPLPATADPAPIAHAGPPASIRPAGPAHGPTRGGRHRPARVPDPAAHP